MQEQEDAKGFLLKQRRELAAKPLAPSVGRIGAYKEAFFRVRRASGSVEVDFEEGRLKHLASLDSVLMSDISYAARRPAKQPPMALLALGRSSTCIGPSGRSSALLLGRAQLTRAFSFLPKDRDPKWRKIARFTSEELLLLISDTWPARLLGSCSWRALALVRRQHFAGVTTRTFQRHSVSSRSTSPTPRSERREGDEDQVPREMPVHPELAAVLATWKASGWRAMMGRDPRQDDLIVPSREGRNRSVHTSPLPALRAHRVSCASTARHEAHVYQPGT